jgi:S1/P1 Nuclease
MQLTALLAAAAAVVSVPSVHAWGTLGHQTVALLAQQYLLPETISAVQEILNDTTPIYMGRNALWPDQYRLTPEGKFSEGFHYIDGLDGPPPESCMISLSDCPAGGCVMSAIANYVS